MALRKNLEGQLPAMRRAYRRLDKAGKGAYLDALAKVVGYHRKYLIAMFNGAVAPSKPRCRHRRPRYSESAIKVMSEIWKRTGMLCAQRLHAQLALALPAAEKHIAGCTPAVIAELERISVRQIERRLAPYKKRHRPQKRYAKGCARSRIIRQSVPVSVSRASDSAPGLLEIDTVAHAGGSSADEFIWTLNTTDVATGWCALAPVLGTSAQAVVPALERIIDRAPYPVYAIHSDNGSEFINYHLVRLCQQKRIAMTRSRPGYKNDNPRVEQKNFTHVRQHIGYGRYNTPAQLRQLMRVYRCLELVINLFEPSVKLHSKRRDGAKVRKVYEPPQTPLQRLVAHYRARGVRLPAKAAALLREQKTLDIFELNAELATELKKLHSLPAHHHSIQKETLQCQQKTKIPA